LEVAVHKGFAALDTVPHVLTRARILDVTNVHVHSLITDERPVLTCHLVKVRDTFC
jgi:hypothetical protein